MKKYFGFAIGIVLISGCATVFKGSNQSVMFNSEPEGAQIIVDGIPMGQTPQSLSLKKNKYKNVTFKKEGYSSQSMALDTSYDAIALLNIFWDLSTTDLITGNAYEYQPNAFFVKLNKTSSESVESSDSPKPARAR